MEAPLQPLISFFKVASVSILLFGCGKQTVAAPAAPSPSKLEPSRPVIEQTVIDINEASPADVMRAINTAMADTVEQVLPSVVVIRTEATQYITDWYGRLLRKAERPVGQGSGVIIDPRGYVLTNNHVLQGGQRIEVVLNDETAYEAELVGRNEQTDIAVLKIKSEAPTTFPAIRIGDSDKIRVGEMVMAIGSPFSLSSTVTNGLISQKGRAEENLPIVDFIQTSAPINPGNSGGALIDMEGNLIGINTMIRTGSPTHRGSIGIGFAIPSNQALRAAQLIMEGTSPEELPWLGVMMQNTRYGVLFSRIINDSPAEEAGLKAGDLLISVNERSIRTGEDLSSLVRLSDPGDRLMLEVLRGNKAISLAVTTRLMDMDELSFP
jgi:serine protease Do